VDTAGFSVAATDPVERLGIERSREALARADLALLVFDISQPPSEADEQIAALVGNRPAILVLNKIDLVPADDWEFDNSLWRAPRVPVSALTGEGLEALESAIVDTVLSGQVSASEAPLVTSPRHKEALCRAAEHVQAALSAHSDGQPADMVAIDLAGAVNALGEITGQTASEDLLESIFANFCVGK
jgi:tRNA modification GTPase